MRWKARAVLSAAIGLGILLIAHVASARPGGGQGFSGGGGGGAGGGGGGDLGLILWLIRLMIEYPQVGVPAVVLYVVFVRARRNARGQTTWEVGTIATARVPLRRADFDAVRARDPEFSRVLFEDFVYALYAEAHKARNDPDALDRLSPYLEPTVRQQLASRAPQGVPVQAVIVGSMRILEVRVPPPAPAGSETPAQVSVELRANLVLPGATQYVQESWTLIRSLTAVTRPWEGVRRFGCPGCGAPFESGGNVCASCGRAVDSGRMDWTVRRALVGRVEPVPPSLTGTVEERGTDLPTIAQAGVRERWDVLEGDDPGLTRESLSARLGLVFEEVNAAWAAQRLDRARPFVSDALCEYLQYWIDAYRAQGLVNAVEGARIERWVIVRVERDRHYDAITVRLWGSGRDVTRESASGAVVAGDPGRDRRYSEYWTLIRGAGVRGAPRADKACPSCGAPLAVNMAGNCEYCGTLVTRGDFDWVLSRIEQDDVYAG